MSDIKDIFGKKEYFVNRELSWVEFNKRVLSEARDKSVPLFERMKFLAITASNLDEFFMVRVASLKDMVHAGYTKKDISGMNAKEQLKKLSEVTHDFVDLQYSTLNRSLLPNLKKIGLRFIGRHEELSASEAEFIDNYFKEYIYPVLTPMAMDASRPFPLVRNKTLNIAAVLKRKEEVKPLFKTKKSGGKKSKKEEDYIGYVGDGLDFAIVQVPGVLPRIVEIPVQFTSQKNGIKKTVILLEEIIEKNIDKLFLNYDIISSNVFRIMRNAEFELDEEDAADLLEEIAKKLKKRQWGEVIRLEIEDMADRKIRKVLEEVLNVENDDLFNIKGPLDLSVFMKLYFIQDFNEYKTPTHVPQQVKELMNDDDIFSNIRKKDILLSHPYHSFEPVIDFIKAAAKDDKVLAIKQTLYRVSGNSPIISALALAAENGKQVTVLVELKARFDEENNILWAKKLEKAGCHVIYGLVGLKTHSKITLVVRNEEDGIRRYVHLGTGNYNDSTAKLYTDMGIFTCKKRFGEDATAVFNMLSGYSEPLSWNKLIVAPLWMKDRFLEKINKAAKAAMNNKQAVIIAKMNSLSDKDIIMALYRASAAGVKIQLIVRGICCLRVGIPGVSENISVHSIVGNFLEHARIFYFNIDGSEEYYLGSADWMNRNLEKRVEIVFPVDDDDIKEKIKHYLDIQLLDNVKASIYMPDGSYEKMDLRGKTRYVSQDIFICEAMDEVKNHLENQSLNKKRVFIPAEGMK